MAFVRLNGWTIDVQSCQEVPQEIGLSRRSYSGTRQTNRRDIKRSWQCITTPLDFIDAEALKGILWGRGQQLKFDGESLYTDIGVAPDVTTGVTFPKLTAADSDAVKWHDGTDSFVPGKYGAHSIFVHGAATTNVLSQNQRDGTEDGTTTGFTSFGTAALSSDTTHYYQGARSIKTVTSATFSGFYVSTSVSASTTYWGSAFVKASAGDPIYAYVRDQVNGTNGTIETFTAEDDTWIRVWATHTMGVGGTTARLYVYTPNNGVTYYTDALQLEEEASGSPSPFFGTNWVDGSSSATAPEWAVETTSPNDLTVQFWANLSSFGSGSFDYVFNLYETSGSYSNNFIGLAKNTVSGAVLRFFVNGASSADLSFVPSSGMNLYTIKASPTATGGTYVSIYENGVEVVNRDSSFTFPTITSPGLLVGTLTPTSAMLFAPIDEFMICPYAAPQSLALAWYNMGTSLPNLPAFYVDGDSIPEPPLTLLAQGEVNDASFVGLMGSDGVWQNNAQVIKFTIHEV